MGVIGGYAREEPALWKFRQSIHDIAFLGVTYELYLRLRDGELAQVAMPESSLIF